ncbi:MAG: SpoIIE family protein phosphatase [Pirellulales bacterium]|nr:SpoIIE family protein phosphatase [Pirellulales bacterium]
MKLSIRTRLLLTIGVPLVVIWLAAATYEYVLERRTALTDTKAHLTELTARQAAQLDVELTKVEQLADTLAAVLAASPELSRDQVKHWLRTTLRGNADLFDLGVVLDPGVVRGSSGPFAPYYQRDASGEIHYSDFAEVVAKTPYSEWYAAAKAQRRSLWSESYSDKETQGRMMCTYGSPVLRGGRAVGMVMVDLLSENILDDILHATQGQEYCTLISREGRFISHPDAEWISRRAAFQTVDKSEAGNFVPGEKGMYQIEDERTGLRSWMVFAPVPSTGWTLAAIKPESEVLAPVQAELARSVRVLVVACLLMLGVLWLTTARMTRPIGRLTAAAESLAEGDLDARVPSVPGTDEIARLAQTFNKMVGQLKTNIEGRIREEAARKEVEGELQAARKIQAALLPRALPDRPEQEFTLHGVNAPAKTVAGDFFDFFFVDERTLAVVMADVSGKGVPAALYMAVARTMLRNFASPDKTPAEVVAQLNKCLAAENHDNMFVTLFVGYYDTASGELSYANAGHNPPYVVRDDGRLESLDPTGPLVAPFPDAAYEDDHCRIEPRDLFVFYTDGVTEAVSTDGQFYGEERLESLLRSLTARPAHEVCRDILESVTTFSAGDLADDATVLVLGRTHRKAAFNSEPTTPVSAGVGD